MNIQNKYSKIVHIKMYKYYVKMYMYKQEKGKKTGDIGKKRKGKARGRSCRKLLGGQIQSSKTY